MALFDAFLKIEGIQGESTNRHHKNEIDIMSFSFGASRPTSQAGGGGGGAGKVSFSDFNIMKQVDTASPQLFDSICSGDFHKEAVFTLSRSGGFKESQADFYKITFENVLISSVQNSGSAGGQVPAESVSLNFVSFKIEARRQQANGGLGPWVQTQCDLQKGEIG